MESLIANSLSIKTIQSFHNLFHFTSCKLFWQLLPKTNRHALNFIISNHIRIGGGQMVRKRWD